MHRFFAVITLLVMGGLGSLDAATVLVLPFFNHSKLEGIDWIGESISEAVHDSLSSEGLLVVDREDRLEAYRRLSLRPGAELTRASIIKIGQTLDADSIVFGSYELLSPSSFKSDSGKDDSKGTLRIAARLIDLKRLAAGSEFSELGAIEDLTALENHLSWQTLGFVDEKTKPNEQEFLRKRPVVRLDAVESYVRGLLAQNPDERHRYFMKAARLDEHYSQPCFQLGKAAWTMRDYRATANWLARVNHSDPHYFEAQFFLGLCRYNLRDFPGAEQAFQVVAAAVPLNEVYNDLAAAQSRQGNFPAAAANFRKALEGDSSDPDYYFNLGYVLWRSGKVFEAVASFRATLERNPHDAEATTLLGRALKDDGPKPGDTRAEARERLKTSYEENAYKQLQAELHSRK
ncbi:MAG: tetratricopeptide repeat protein [Acidobacteriia bacterium]|nr:tetratricopeptide repeat protein [Terriglobia bacterium]